MSRPRTCACGGRYLRNGTSRFHGTPNDVPPDDAPDVLDLAFYLAAAKKAEELGEDALDDDERAVLEQGARFAKRLARAWRKSMETHGDKITLGMNIYEARPDELRERWGNLKPAELAMLALVFPEELPPDARRNGAR